jgi:NAD(P)H-hydrate epimerase
VDGLHQWLPPRYHYTHKGECGRVLCIGGDHGRGGAIVLCAEAALRCGTGLLTVAPRALHVPVALTRRPEAMAVAVESDEDLLPLLAPAEVIAIGPGLGQNDWGRAMFRLAMASAKPLVVDADALNLLSQSPYELRDAILTPHPGEAARLLGIAVDEVQRDRFTAAQAIAQRYAAVVVLKGAGTIVTAPDVAPCWVDAGNPGMATGGMGDLLTGVIASLRGQGLSAFDAACAGALLHALAGDEAAEDGERGLLPSDLLPHLRKLANPVMIEE